jgi:phosphoserine aminotransferase
MNICFNAVNKDLESKFIHLCAQNGILGIEGHRSVGGFRVSLYNAVPLKWVHSLLDIMNHLATIA